VSNDSEVLVVGASVAAGALITQLRLDGYEGRVLVVDQDRDAPYDRPPLSKNFLSTTEERPHAPWWDDRCERLVGRAYRLDVDAKAVDVERTDGSTARGYAEHVVIATGSGPVRLPGQPDGVVHLRTARDARALREYARQGRHVIILGAGTIGTELASSITAAGGQATVIDTAGRPLQRFFGGHLGDDAAAWIREAGVDLHLSTRAQEISRRECDWVVTTDLGEHTGDLVLSAVGTRPATAWLHGSGLDISDGVRCNANGAVLTERGTPASGIHAIGDVAAWPDLQGVHRRSEDWTTAQRHGRAVGGQISGADTRRELNDLPYFWTHQFGRRIQVLGTPDPDGVLTTQVSDPEKHASFHTVERDGRTVAWISINRPREFALAMRESVTATV
jgi:3-phenylpropionate/trans-cinnamate dioxygenase ferredoxin reductase subunit